MKINNTPIQTWDDIQEQYIANLGGKIVFQVENNGQVREIVYNPKVMSKENIDLLNFYPWYPAAVGEVQAGYPASEAGLKMVI